MRFQPSARMRSAGAVRANGVRSVARRQISGEKSVRDHWRALRRNAFVVVLERAKSRTVRFGCVGDNVHDVAAIFQLAQFLGGEERHAGEVGFHAEHAIEFDRMSNRFVDLQSELRRIENDVVIALRTLIGFVQGDGFFRDASSVLQQLQFFDQFVAFVLPLTAERVRIRALHDLASGERVRGVTGADSRLHLVDVRAVGVVEPLLVTAEIEVGLGERDSSYGAQLGVNLQQQIDVLLH